MMGNKTIYAAARSILEERLAAIRSHARRYPRARPPHRRRRPTADHLWSEYARAMITSQQRSTPEGSLALRRDKKWQNVRLSGATSCPSAPVLERILRSHSIRFPHQKAARMVQAAERDFEALASLSREVLLDNHDRGARRGRLRREELRVAVAIQEELRGCGVAPKIARLMMGLVGEFEHVVPLDSRWMSALERAGAAVDRGAFARESTYRIIEDEIVAAAYDLRVLPLFADGAVFGWIEPLASGGAL